MFVIFLFVLIWTWSQFILSKVNNCKFTKVQFVIESIFSLFMAPILEISTSILIIPFFFPWIDWIFGHTYESILLYVIKLIIALVVVPIFCLLVKVVICKRLKISLVKHYYFINILLLNWIFITITAIWYYTWFIEYSFSHTI